MTFHNCLYRGQSQTEAFFFLCTFPSMKAIENIRQFIAFYANSFVFHLDDHIFGSFLRCYGDRSFFVCFGVTVGAVTEEQIKKYIENQLDEPGSFKVWDEAEESEKDMADLQSDSSDYFRGL